MEIPKRRQWVEPAWDCRLKCIHDEKGDHGFHAEEWRYAVVGREGALDLVVLTDHYLDPKVCDGTRLLYPDISSRVFGQQMRFHCIFSLSENDVRGKVSPKPCELLPQGCYEMSQGLNPSRFFDSYGNPHAFQQGERFWDEFEDLFVDLMDDAERRRADHLWECCQFCGGKGVISREARLEVAR